MSRIVNPIRKLTLCGCGLIAATTIFINSSAGAQEIPNWVNYQGRLTAPTGVPVQDGPYRVTFRLFGSNTGGAELWSEVQDVTTRGGVFNTTLGRIVTFPSDLFTKPLWIEIVVNDKALGPRQALGSVPFSMKAMSLPNGTVGTVMLANLAVTTEKIANGAVTTEKLAVGAVTTDRLRSGAVVEGKIKDGAVTTMKIADSAVTEVKITNSSVTSQKLGDLSVIERKLADGSVSNSKLLNDSVTESKIASGSVSSSHLKNDSDSLNKVSGGKLSVNDGQVAVPVNTYIGYWPPDRFSYRGKYVGQASIGWYWDDNFGDGLMAYLSGYGGIRFFTGGQSRLRLAHDGRLYLDNRGWGGEPTIDFAIGDTDTGFHWAGDGAIDFYANGTKTAELRPDRFTVTSRKEGVVQTKNFGKRALYAVESPEVRFTDEGISSIRNGETTVKVDPVFLETTEGKPVVHITPYGDSSLFVFSISRDSFVVKVRKGEPDTSFSWQVSYKRKGYSNVRLETR